jgi:hypothetical protein
MRKRYLFLPLLVAQLSTAFAQVQDAAPVDAKALLTQLHDLKEKHSTAEKAQNNKAIQDLLAAANSNATAVAFYQEAVRYVQFAGQNHENKEFRDWKQKEADRLKSAEFQTAARLHLIYLALTLQRASGTKVPDLMPGLLNYVNLLATNYPLVWNQELMTKSVTDGIFSRWLGLDRSFSNFKDWEVNAGNLDGIYQKTILPQMRKDKDPKIVQYWDDKLNREKNKASNSGLAFKVDNFNLVDRPEILWSRAEDMLIIGQKNRAIGEMFAVVKNFPDHPKSGSWIGRLEAILSGKADAASGAESNTAPTE